MPSVVRLGHASISARSNRARLVVEAVAHVYIPLALLVEEVDGGGARLRLGRLAVVVLVRICRAIPLFRRRGRGGRLLVGGVGGRVDP